MSVIGGNFGHKRIVSYAVGAPRANHTGSVLITIENENPNKKTLEIKQILKGEQYGSGYGYQIIKADVNGDR